MRIAKELGVAGMLLFALTACSKDNTPVAQTSQEQFHFRLYHQPGKGWIGDVMPYYVDGKYELYYLHDATNLEKQSSKGQHAIHKLSGSNLLHMEDQGEMIPFEDVRSQDHLLGTGSVVKVGELFYFYYTGHNSSASWLENNNPIWTSPNSREAVRYATSSDGRTWKKKADFVLRAPLGYERNEFRDPYVFYNEEFGEYWMLVSTRQNGRGVLLYYTTNDPASNTWQPHGPLDIEGDYHMLECPDMFRIGDRYYLLFAEDWSGTPGTHYRVASSTKGPWKKPENGADMFDGHQFYAGKTASDGSKRYAFAWAHRRFPESDNGARTWGGNLITHEIYAVNEGKLEVKIPEAYLSEVAKDVAWRLSGKEGNVTESEYGITLNSIGTEASANLNELDGTVRIEANVTWSAETETFSLLFGDGAYEVRFEKENKRIAGYKYGEKITEVPFDFSPSGSGDLRVIVDGSVLVIYLNDEVALTNRSYSLQKHSWGIKARGGTVSFSDLKLYGVQ